MSNELALSRPGSQSIIPDGSEWQTMEKIAETIVRSGLAPQEVNTPQKALVIILKARELGVPPMQALSTIHVVKGKPTLAADLMVALLRREGHKVWVVETTDEYCTMKGHRKSEPEHLVTVTFTKQDAIRAGKWGKDNWAAYPAQMLYARCAARICRMVAPDVLAGMYTADELGASVSYNDDGHEVIEGDLAPPLKLVKEETPTADPTEEFKQALAVVTELELLQHIGEEIGKAGYDKKDPRRAELRKLYLEAEERIKARQGIQAPVVEAGVTPVEEEESITPDQLEIDCPRCGDLMGLQGENYVCYDKNCRHIVAASFEE